MEQIKLRFDQSQLRFSTCLDCGNIWATEDDAAKCCHGEFSTCIGGKIFYTFDLPDGTPYRNYVTMPKDYRPEWTNEEYATHLQERNLW